MIIKSYKIRISQNYKIDNYGLNSDKITVNWAISMIATIA